MRAKLVQFSNSALFTFHSALKMNPSLPHPEYLTAQPAWSRARAVIAGEDAVKSAGKQFLPRLDSQTDDEYASYKARASFYNASSRTAAGYIGMIFRRAPFIKLTPPNSAAGLVSAMDALGSDFDMRGTSLQTYAKNVVTEVIHVGRAGTMIDWSDAENRAYASLYKAEDILNWRTERINGRNTLTLVTLAELASIPTDDPFVTTIENRIRVLRLVKGRDATPLASAAPAAHNNQGNEAHSEGRDGAPPPSASTQDSRPSTQDYSLVVELWREVINENQKTWKLVESHTPKRLGKPLPFIPFVFHGPRHSRPDVDKPPLEDVIAINLDHYRLDADYKHGVHFTALPTVWVAGFDPDSSLKIGSTTAWISSTIGATAGFLEFTGQGLETFERAMERDERLMAILGTRLLESQKREAETAEALQIRHAGEESILTSIATSLSESVSSALKFATWWMPASGASGEESPDALTHQFITLNTDFGIKGITGRDLQAIVAAWQAGAISQDTMFELFRKGEILPDGRSNSEELSLLTRNPNPDPGRAAAPPGAASESRVTTPPPTASIQD
jgi:hypothetical protein